MKAKVIIGVTALAGAAVVVGQVSALADRPDPSLSGGDFTAAGDIGPDVIVGSIPDIHKWGGSGGIGAYSIATTSCNIGDEVLQWQSGNNNHPVIGQNIYRLKDGRFEQIGQSFLKHGFCALSGTLCGPCQSTSCPTLGIGCSDPYTDTRNGSQSTLGPKSEVNAANGFFPYPFSNPSGGGTIFKRMQVDLDDLNPSLNPGALYFVESQYVAKDDAIAGNDSNNASYRKCNVGSFSGGAYNLSLSGSTQQQAPGVQAWQDNDPEVEIAPLDIAGDGRFVLGSKATDNGDGTWHYEFALFNQTSHKSASAFHVPVPSGATITNVGFHDVDYHSGDGADIGTAYDGTDWDATIDCTGITWNTQTVTENPNANALRWGTVYNFRFDADIAPVDGEITITTYRNPADFGIAAQTPPADSGCFADFDGNNIVDGADLGLLLGAWGSDTCFADLNNDGMVDGADLGLLLGAWGDC